MKKYFLIIFLPINTYAQIVITNGLSHVYQSSPNGQIVGQIKLKNIGKTPQAFTSSKYNIMFICGSGAFFSDTQNHDRSLNEWLEFDVDEKTLNPKEEFNLTYRINLPNNITSGTYWGAAMVEPGDPIVSSDRDLKVQNKARYAIQIIVDLGSFESPKLVYRNVSLTKNNSNGRIVKVELENTGFFAVPVKVQLEVYDSKGTKIQVAKAESKRIYPTRCNTYDIEVKNLPPGKYDGVIISDTGKKIFGSNISIKIE
ncbi:hypothetical protein GCM10011514_09710 [Emticicia aquatilis]|uniref:Uncharacterized protein n=1 Tax=Emticicia aquatilis TaxID=1537369 RepID=A0A916YJ97_9BACT|nr:hypothetical protein [Emticicia aquatilis]GGD47791.1 hypothetical protein GCM10011514_09710 [Emticicia aquatilis]